MKTIILLVVAALLVAILAVHAHASFVYHRQAAEAVLRDYARLAAGELIRRITVEVGYNGYFPLVTALRARALDDPVPSAEDLEARLDDRSARAASLVRTVFRFHPGSGELETRGAPLSEPARQWLIGALAERPAEADRRRPYHVLHWNGGEVAFSFITAPAGDRADAPVVGFAVAADELAAWFRRAYESGPLLPPSLGQGAVDNEMLFVAVEDALDRPVFRAGGYAYPALETVVPFGETYNGILDGMKVITSIDPEGASALVIGGLPRSRLPLLMALLALTLGLLAAAVVQLRRERKLARMRSDFVAQVSHELRTPLAQIRIFTETLLLGRSRNAAETRRALEVLDREARRLCHLVDNTLQFSRSERGAVQLVPRVLSPATLIREVVDGFRLPGGARAARIVLDLDESLWCTVDEDASRQVIINLLDNALKYGPGDQEIRLGLVRQEDHARITVDDQGSGVPEGERGRIWERFQRLERHRQAAVSGAGIGLTVVRELVERQGGRVWVEDGERGGACFCVELPLARSHDIATTGETDARPTAVPAAASPGGGELSAEANLRREDLPQGKTTA